MRITATAFSFAIMLAACAQTPAPPAMAAPPNPVTTAEAYPEVAAAFDTLAADGLRGAILFRSGDGAAQVFVHGDADCEGRQMIDRTTRFDIGSITKYFTAAAIFKLAEEGGLSTDAALGDLLPGAPADKAAITVKQLLTHTSGLPDSLGVDEDYVGKAQYLEMAFAAPLLFAPGAQEEYSNVGFALLGAIIESLTGRRYEDALQTLVLAPAGTAGIGYFTDRARNACGLLDGKKWGATRDYFSDEEPSWHLVGNGGLHATPEELTGWFDALFAGKILNADSVAKYEEIIRRTDKRGRPVRVASGSNNIFSALYLGWPNERTVLMIMTSDSRFQKEKVTPVMFPAINAYLDRTLPALQ